MQSLKITTYVCHRFNTSFCARDHKKETTGYIKFKVLNQINPNLGGLSKGSLLPPCSNKTTSLKNDTFI